MPRLIGRFGIGLLAFDAGCTGIENNPVDLHPTLAVSPLSVVFGDVGPPDAPVKNVTLTNEGKAELKVTGELQGSPVFTLAAPLDVKIPAGDHLDVPITFTPDTYKDYASTLVLHTNDTDHADATIPITGSGVDLPYPDIDIQPSRTVVADHLQPGFSALMRFDIFNVGDAPLVLSDVNLEHGNDNFTLVEPSVQPDGSFGSILPGGSTEAVIQYDPDSVKGDNEIVHILSNDPDADEKDMTVLLLGNGGDDWPIPVAAIDCTDPVLLNGPVTTKLSGAASYDPSGFDPLTYKWKVLKQPDGSDLDIALDPSNTESVDLYVDVAGPWKVQLVVTNQLGTESEPAVCTFLAQPEDALHVELSWDTPAADLDLHLIEGGSSIFDQPEDCFFCNKDPKWGESTSDDDPRLDIDDQGGFGPENINILAPVLATYDVKVHYFASHGDKTAIATVKVWLNGVQVGPDYNQALDVNDVWYVGVIDMNGSPDPTFFTKGDITKGGATGCGG